MIAHDPGRGRILAAMNESAARGYVTLASSHSVADTCDRLESLLKAHDVLLFARIDFSGDAARAGLSMRPEQLVLFGNPRAGTPLMVIAAAAGLDLPLKALVWEDAAGKTWVAYNDPQYVLQRHGLPESFARNLAAAIPLIERAAAG
jgi:uncharacterized protein (DUF302 family)